MLVYKLHRHSWIILALSFQNKEIFLTKFKCHYFQEEKVELKEGKDYGPEAGYTESYGTTATTR